MCIKSPCAVPHLQHNSDVSGNMQFTILGVSILSGHEFISNLLIPFTNRWPRGPYKICACAGMVGVTAKSVSPGYSKWKRLFFYGWYWRSVTHCQSVITNNPLHIFSYKVRERSKLVEALQRNKRVAMPPTCPDTDRHSQLTAQTTLANYCVWENVSLFIDSVSPVFQ